jgi:tRNA-specific 2-thiouridylase
MRFMSRVLCAMSGGVDSSVAALLLKEAGHQVIGAFLRLGPDAAGAGRDGRHRGCCSVQDSRDAALVASRLGIPFYAMNYQGEFARVIDYFVEEYHRGRTPNPCARCNQWLKFGSLAERARALGCEAVATGHYARIDHGQGRPRLLRAADPAKDQSYFLFLLPRETLGRTLFPVGGLRKPEVRAIARRAGLPVAEKPDSQEICFVPGDYREVLRARNPERLLPGRFVDSSGRELGGHQGHQNFTIGQRRGLGVALGSPRYVVAIEPAENLVVLGDREELARTEALVEEVGWLSVDEPPAGISLAAEVQIRHRHRPVPARVTALPGRRAQVEFAEPVEAVTPGQAAVFYSGEVLLGGGWIGAA